MEPTNRLIQTFLCGLMCFYATIYPAFSYSTFDIVTTERDGMLFTDTTDMDPGATWYYQGFYSPDQNGIGGGICVAVIEHQIIDGKYCYILGKIEDDIIYPESNIPVYSKDKKVYFYEDGEWLLLYDYNAEPGDTVTYYITKKSNHYFIGGDLEIEPNAFYSNPHKLRVESIDTISNGVGGQIRKFNISKVGDGLFHDFDFILDGLGFDWGFFGLNDVSFVLDGTFPIGLSCYYEKEIQYLHPHFPKCKISSVSHVDNLNAISIYPNPAYELLNIEINSESKSTYVFNIMDTQGRILKSGSLRGVGHYTLDIADLPKGMYFINILNDDYSVAVQKFIKQ